MADQQDGRARQIMAMIFLERPELPDLERLKDRFGEILNIGDVLPAHANAQVVPADGSLLIAALVDTPLPEQHWRVWADGAWWWPEAGDTMTGNAAHLVVSSAWDHSSRLDGHLKHMIVVREFIEQLPAVAVAWGNVLVSASQFAGEFQRFQAEKTLPVRLFVQFQVSADGQGGTILSTTGMDAFGLKEIEANPAPMEPKDALDFVENFAGYLMTNGPVVKSGDTIGGSDEQRIKVNFAPSFRESGREVYLIDFGPAPGPREDTMREFAKGLMAQTFGSKPN
ncbi:MAG: DUF4261 domain-containing protein [Hyphomicrobiaceae bacterium]